MKPQLFNDHFLQMNIKRASNGEICSIDFSTPKFHDLPYAMQQGIWFEFANETVNRYFEQPEYSYDGDLEEDGINVFGETEELIED